MGLFGLTRKSKKPVIINEYYTYNTPTYNTSAVCPPSPIPPSLSLSSQFVTIPLIFVTDRHGHRLGPGPA